MKFRLHWLGSKTPEIVEGSDIADACVRAGYSGGAIQALDYYVTIHDDDTDDDNSSSEE